MFTNRRRKQNSNQSPMGRKWYPIGGGFSYTSNSYSTRNNYNTYDNTTKKGKNPNKAFF